MRIAALALGLMVMLLSARRADACGYWTMADVGKKRTIGYLINAASIYDGKKRIATQYLDVESKEGLRTTRGKKVVLDIKGDKLRKLGKVIGTVDFAAGTVTIKGTSYAITLEDAPKLHDMPTYKLTVKRGDEVIITSNEASALCAAMAKGGMTEAESREEISRRVVFYLAWRETGN